MNTKEETIERFEEWSSESSFSVEKIKNLRKPTNVHPVSDGKRKEPASKSNILDPQGSLLQKWNKIFVITCVMALSVDLSFLFVPVIDAEGKCLNLDHPLLITASVLRTILDLFYILHIICQFRTGFIEPSSREFGRVELIDDPRAIVKRYLSSYFTIDILSIIPLPQVLLAIIPSLDSSAAKDWLVYLVLFQEIPRALTINLLLREVTRTSGVLTEIAWARAAINLCLCVLISHIIGASWYVLSVEKELRCWHQELKKANLSAQTYLSCGQHNSITVFKILNGSCPLVDPDDIKHPSEFNFGIFFDALKSHVVESNTNFPRKIFYCFWWSLRNLSSLGQNLKTSTDVVEIMFAVKILFCGLFLFTSLIRSMQQYLESVEEIRMKTQKSTELQQWMSRRMLPYWLRKRISQYEYYNKKQENRGAKEETIIQNLPKDLRRNVMRHLCLGLLKKVPMFEKIDEKLLDALCDRLKPVLYTKSKFIVGEGDPIDEMLFITRGELTTMTTNGGRTGFFNSFVMKAGDFYGEELLTWALDPNSSPNLPISTRTVESTSEVEAFALMANDLKFVTSQFRRLNNKHIQHTFRYYSLQWRTWGACFIQAAWRHYCRRKIEKSLHEAEDKLLDALENEEGSTASFIATIYASRFAANALRDLRKYDKHTTRMPQKLLPLMPQKPTEPDFTSQELYGHVSLEQL